MIGLGLSVTGPPAIKRGYPMGNRKTKVTVPSDMASTESPKSGTPITFHEYIQHDGFVTGVARYQEPTADLGDFQIRVSGQPESVNVFGAEARILSLRIVPITARDGYLEEQHAAWLKRNLERFKRSQVALLQLLDLDKKADLAAWSVREADLLDLISPSGEHDLDFERHRLVEIQVLSKLNPKQAYRLSLQIDPSVAVGTCDIFRYSGDTGEIGEMDASITVQGGNPDLYLYQGGAWRDDSTHGPGQSESVHGDGTSGTWRLHVHGQGAGSTYTLNASWIIKNNDQRQDH